MGQFRGGLVQDGRGKVLFVDGTGMLGGGGYGMAGEEGMAGVPYVTD